VIKWETLTLDHVTAEGSDGLRRGPFGGAVKKEIFVTDGYKIYEQRHAIYGDFDAGSYYIGETHYRALRSFAVEPGDLIVSCSGTIGRVAIVPTTAKPGIINQALLRIRPKLRVVSSGFLKRLLETPDIQARLFGSAGGSAIKNVKPLNEIRRVKFSLPPLAEQRRIAEILDRAEALRAKRCDALTQVDSLNESIFLDLFGDPATNPKCWPKIALQDCTAKIQIGPFGSLLHQEDYVSGGIALVNPKHIQNCRIVPSHTESVTLRKFKDLQSFQLQAGDMIMGRRGEMGRCAIVEKEATPLLCGTGSLFIRPDRVRTESRFLCAMLSSKALKLALERLSLGQTLPNLNSRIVEQLSIPLPPVALQREFSDRVKVVERLKTTQSTSLAELDSLFASLQQRAFRGEL